MVKFNYINWVTENKHNLLSEQCRQKSQELVDSYSAEELQSRLDQIMMDMEQEAEPEGGPIADMYADEMDAYEGAIRIARGTGKTDSLDVKIRTYRIFVSVIFDTSCNYINNNLYKMAKKIFCDFCR